MIRFRSHISVKPNFLENKSKIQYDTIPPMMNPVDHVPDLIYPALKIFNPVSELKKGTTERRGYQKGYKGTDLVTLFDHI